MYNCCCDAFSRCISKTLGISNNTSMITSVVNKIADSATDNRYLILSNEKLKKIFEQNEVSSPGVTRSYAHISCDPNTGIIRNPARLGDSIKDTANIFIYRTVNLQVNTSGGGGGGNNSNSSSSTSSTSWFPLSVTRVQRKTHLWYIYTTPDFSDYAIRVLIETERELNSDIIPPNQWGSFVCEKIKVIRNDHGFFVAYRWLTIYNRRHFSQFYSYWQLFWNQSNNNTNTTSISGNVSNSSTSNTLSNV
jgi:hypothetical protein